MSDVVNRFDRLINIDNERDQADPWLVALAVEKTEQDPAREYIVVTQEKQASSVKLPAACRGFGVGCIPLAQFFDENGITFGISVS